MKHWQKVALFLICATSFLAVLGLVFGYWLHWDAKAIVPLLASAAALILSVANSYESNFSGFKLDIINSSPRLKMYVHTPPKRKLKKGEFYRESTFTIDLSIALYNEGARSGRLRDMRIRVVKDGSDKTQEFSPQWIVNYQKYRSADRDAFDWHDQAVEAEWYPIFVPPGKEVTRHVVFQGWTVELPKGAYKFFLEYQKDREEKWRAVEEYRFHVSKWAQDELKSGSSFVLTPRELVANKREAI